MPTFALYDSCENFILISVQLVSESITSNLENFKILSMAFLFYSFALSDGVNLINIRSVFSYLSKIFGMKFNISFCQYDFSCSRFWFWEILSSVLIQYLNDESRIFNANLYKYNLEVITFKMLLCLTLI